MNRLPKLSALSVEDAGWGYFLCAYKEFRTGRSGSEFLFLSWRESASFHELHADNPCHDDRQRELDQYFGPGCCDDI